MTDSATELSPWQVARAWGVTMNYVYNLLYAGRLEARKDGREWRIPRRVVEARARKNGGGGPRTAKAGGQ